MRPTAYSKFSGYNEVYENEFREFAETHLGRKSTNQSQILSEALFLKKHLILGTKIKKFD